MIKPTVFISYSHKDEKWKDLFTPQLKVLAQAGRIDIWDDRRIDGGSQWFNDIKEAIDRAAVAVCLISADYLASDFCNKEEIPYLLERRDRAVLVILPALVRPCMWQVVSWLKSTQIIPRDGKSISVDFKGNEDEAFRQVVESVLNIIDDPNRKHAAPPPLWPLPDMVNIGRLPVTGAELFGRREELQMLDAAWESDDTHVVSLVAWGGVGKSTLVNKWLEKMSGDNYRGARRVYAWSFYSQGTGDRVTSADLFINNALEWFGDPEPTAGSPWDKGERLAKLVRREKTLLLLDGLEPLQSPHEHERGKVKDPALSTLLTGLALDNQGLCLITTREPVTDLAEFSQTVLHKDLEQISDEAGRALLRVGGVQGTDAELEQATRDFGNHALAVNLLAVYLHDISGHHIAHAVEIPDLNIPDAAGKHPRRLLAVFAQRFGDGPEGELLRVLGLFNRPTDSESLAALRAAPPILGLTDHLHSLSEADWLRLIEKLRRTKLIAPAGHHGLTDLDAHPLVREHFGQELTHHHPAAWREGNNRLYEHLTRTAKEFPATLEEIASLYEAMEHGCNARRHREVLHKVYWRRIQRGDQNFSWRQLGIVSANLAVLSNFFDASWKQPVLTLSENDRNFILSDAGFYFMVLGRFKEAIQPFRIALDEYVAQGSFEGASVAAGNLCEIYSAIGDLHQALSYAQKSVDMTTNIGDMIHHVTSRAYVATVLYFLGYIPEAETAFREAEKIQAEDEPRLPYLYSISGFWYCSLLMDQGRYQAVIDRLGRTCTAPDSLLDVALEYLSLGQAHMLQAQKGRIGTLSYATEYLSDAMKYLRQNVSQGYLARGLLARAELYRVKGEFDRAQADLDEAMRIAIRSSMSLHEADCHLEYARLYLAQGERQMARESLATAKEMIERMSYHRRNKDIEAVEKELHGL